MAGSAFFGVNSVTMAFGNLVALNDLSFEVEKGQIFGIAGPNGSGKTTLLNVIAGVLIPKSGSIYLRGDDIVGFKPREVCYKGIARTFQIPEVFPTLTVLDNIRVGLSFGHGPRKNPARDLDEIIDFVGLTGKENILAANIDLYTRKLLMLAAALATDPDILLLDEPLGGLNISEIDDYLRLVRQLNEKMGITFLVVEHVFDKLVEISERILIIDFGKKIYLGSSEEVTEDPRVIEVYLGMKHA
jgi:branched-chain amino acid transport system ATP-binding protein